MAPETHQSEAVFHNVVETILPTMMPHPNPNTSFSHFTTNEVGFSQLSNYKFWFAEFGGSDMPIQMGYIDFRLVDEQINVEFDLLFGMEPMSVEEWCEDEAIPETQQQKHTITKAKPWSQVEEDALTKSCILKFRIRL